MGTNLRKDWLALSAAMFLGALFAHSLGYSIELGVLAGLIGGVLGYVFCLLTEPKLIILAACEAWRKTTEWLPLPDWRSRLEDGVRQGLGLGGPYAVVLGFGMTISEKWATLSEQAVSYVFWSFLLSTLFIFFGMILEYSVNKPNPNKEFVNRAARNWNVIAIHLHAVRLTLIAVNYLFFGLVLLAMCVSENIPAVIWGIPRFAKNFAVSIHSEKTTAFGVYASIGATMIYFLIPYSPVLMAIAAIVCGGVGAYARPVVLRWLQSDLARAVS